MKVILLKSLAKLGKLGLVVKVKSGFARNYLIPKGIAKLATKEAIAEVERTRQERELKEQEELALATELGATIAQQVLEVKVKVGTYEKIFGSVTKQDIVDGLKILGFVLNKNQVVIEKDQLKSVGLHEIKLDLHHGVHANLKVNLVGVQE